MATAAEQIAQQLFDKGVRLDDEYDAGAIYCIPEELKTPLMNLWLSSIDHDTDIVFNATEFRDRLAGQTPQQFIDALLYAKFEACMWQDVDEELWFLQCGERRERIAESRTGRISLPEFLRIPVAAA